jgi:pre-mRNA-splicing factor SYF2
VAAVREGNAWAGMDARQRKLFELRLKLNESRKANQSAVVAEKRRVDAPAGAPADGRGKRGAEAGARSTAERLAAHGLDASKAYLLESMEAAEAGYKKRAPKEASFGWAAYNPEAQFNAAQKRAAALPHDPAAYAAAAAADPEFYRDANSLAYGDAAAPPPAAIDRMVAELKAREEARAKVSRRRKHYEDADIDSINDRNAHFNRKLERTYGAYTAEIKGNLERGTAL